MKCARAAWAVFLLSGINSICLSAPPNRPIKPLSDDGKPLNLDFETGTLKDWTATGDAFDGQPIHGDTVAARRGDMRSAHQGEYWIGGFEVHGDDGTGTLTSVPFTVTHRWASFLMAGGAWAETRVELLTVSDNQVFFKISGTESEELRPVVIDLQKHSGKKIAIRVVDERKGAWGHVNFDDFEFYDEQPSFPNTMELLHRTPISQPDVVRFAGLPPEQAAAAMTTQDGFKVKLFASEPDLVQPDAFTIDQRGRLWVVEAMTYPQRAPEGKGKDRILVFEDQNGAGHFTKRTVFAEGLNLVSGIEVGFGGVYVGAAPYLMFIPSDINADAPAPSGPPQILLDGFGYGDTHETLNTFCWGPDGWLYGCHGVFTDSRVGAPGTPAEKRVHLNAGIWRFHPTRKVFERFAEGTSNPWGIDFDDHGQCFIEACVIPHLWHMIQGAHYMRQGGEHDNPYVYDDIKTIADHVHYAGNAGPHAGNGRSDAAGGGHAHAGMMVYQGGSWPSEFVGQLFMNNIHGTRINMDVPQVAGSGFVGHHGKDFILFNDSWSRIVNLRYDQDGSVYMIDWYDKTKCHTTDPNVPDRGNGRIFKVVYGDTSTTPVDFSKLSDVQLAEQQLEPHEWRVRTARRILQERAVERKLDPAAIAKLNDILQKHPDAGRRLRALWTLHATGNLPVETLMAQLNSDQPYVVGWALQLLFEQGAPAAAVEKLAQLARPSSSPVTRLYVASALLRTPEDQRWAAVEALLKHDEDGADHNLPLMDWWTIEPLCAKDPPRALALAVESKLPRILSFAVRRIGATGPGAVEPLVSELGKINDTPRQAEFLNGIRASLVGRRTAPMPSGWGEVAGKLMASSDTGVRRETQALAIVFGDPEATSKAKTSLQNASAPADERLAAMESLTAVGAADLAPMLQNLLSDPAVRGSAIRSLAGYDDPKTPEIILKQYPNFDPATKKDALGTLASRPAYARALLNGISSGAVPSRDVSADVVRQLRTLNDKELDKQVAKVWGVLRDTPAAKKQRIAQLKGMLTLQPAKPDDMSRGRVLFSKTCMQCHTLYDVGGHVGPNLTGSNRHDLDYLLENMVDPNAVIPADYRTTQIETTNGRTILGIVKKEDEKSVTVVMPTEDLVLPKAEIQSRRISPMSMMPEGILDTFPEQDIRDLVAYLRGSKQVDLPPETAQGK